MISTAFVRSTIVLTLVAAVAGPPPAAAQVEDYLIGPQDSLAIAVWNQADLTGVYAVEADGTFTFPLVGRVQAGGLTLRQFEAELTRLLDDGFLKSPQVTVAVEEYRSQRIFVVGQVRDPGTYPLTGGMTLIEALASAGSTTATASHEALIVKASAAGSAAGSRGAADDTVGPVLPGDADDANVITVDIEALQSGRAAQNVALHDGDTIFVPRAETIFVYGEVTSPGEYPVRRATTILQALAVAGGVTQFGATNRIRVIRVEGDQQREIRVGLDDTVQAGDTIVVPERFF